MNPRTREASRPRALTEAELARVVGGNDIIPLRESRTEDGVPGDIIPLRESRDV